MDINQMARELERDEGLRLRPYRDSVGKLTIGFGRNLDDDGITVEEARHLLYNDIETHKVDLLRSLPWTASLNEVRFRVLLNMTFNMGIARLLGFKRMLAACEVGRYADAAHEMDSSEWARQVGARAGRLILMMETGVTT